MFQDIRTPKQSLRDILPPKSVARAARAAESFESVTAAPPRRRRGGSFFRWLLFFIVLAGVMGGGYVASQSFARATVVVTPKTAELSLNHERLIVPYETLTIDPITASVPVQTTAGSKVEKKASGKVTVYNAYAKTPQALIANTRFEAANGKIYRLTAQATIPAMKADGTPGQATVSVTADQAGIEYNLASSTDKLTIPGFKGSDQFTKIYATLATPIAGGASGSERVLAESDRATALATLKPKLEQQARGAVRAQLPPGYVVFDDSILYTYTETVSEKELTLAVTAEALIFTQEALTKALVSDRLDASLVDQPLTIKNLDALILTPERSSLNPAKKQVEIAVDGKAAVELEVDSERLRTELTGRAKQEAQTIFANYPGIARAEVKVTPPWVQSFPTDPTKIAVALTHN